MSRQKSIAKIRDLLVRRRDALHCALEGDLSLLRELHQERTGDMLDAAADSIQDELNSQLIDAESRELQAINDAIIRFDQGTFGDCYECGKPIPLDRLRAIPYAVDCIQCRRESERRSERASAMGFSNPSWSNT
ncbi:MAG: TraR/DksA family transcriptional regulator [Planctomycetota bacterium]